MNGFVVRHPTSMFQNLAQLQRNFERLFPPGSPSSIRALSGDTFPTINVGTTPDSVEVVAMAPGIDPAQIQVTIDKGLLVLAGERKSQIPEDTERASLYTNERFEGSFRRVLSLPEDVDPTKVQAEYRDGMLRVTLGKRESSKPRRIQVK
ncbi:MAG: Hsp20/alpha crystallin family protein [Burkholderiaceae bacterium]